MDETTSISAESRSTTSVMPSGPMPATLCPQPPTCTAMRAVAVGEVEQDRAHRDHRRQRDQRDGPLQPRPASGDHRRRRADQRDQHGQGVRHRRRAHRDPSSPGSASNSSGSSVSRDSAGVGRSSSMAASFLVGELRDPGVLGIVGDLFVGRQPVGPVDQRQHERRDAHADDDRGEDHRLRQRVGGGGLAVADPPAHGRVARRAADEQDQAG